MKAIRLSVVVMVLSVWISTAFGARNIPLGTTRELAEGDTIVYDLGGGASVSFRYGRDSEGLRVLLMEWVEGAKQGGKHKKDELTFEKDLRRFNSSDYSGGMIWGDLRFDYEVEQLGSGRIKFTAKAHRP